MHVQRHVTVAYWRCSLGSNEIGKNSNHFNRDATFASLFDHQVLCIFCLKSFFPNIFPFIRVSSETYILTSSESWFTVFFLHFAIYEYRNGIIQRKGWAATLIRVASLGMLPLYRIWVHAARLLTIYEFGGWAVNILGNWDCELGLRFVSLGSAAFSTSFPPSPFSRTSPAKKFVVSWAACLLYYW